MNDERIRQNNRLDYDFALSATEVTIQQYRRFSPDYETMFQEILTRFVDRDHSDECPAVFVTCFDAMRYCNWLTLQEGMSPDQCCYDDPGDGTLRAKPDYLRLSGFRLPAFTEWNLACTSCTTTQFSFGNNPRLLPHYAWYFSNSRSDGQHRVKPVARTKPNSLGLSDMYPNWSSISGGSCDNEPVDLQRVRVEGTRHADSREIRVGFRIAQTVLKQAPRPEPAKR